MIFSSTKIRVKFDGSCLNEEKIIFNYKNIINLRIVHQINLWSHGQGADFTLESFLFALFELTENVDPDKYSDSRYSAGFDKYGKFLL